jgi:hypothetical protein
MVGALAQGVCVQNREPATFENRRTEYGETKRMAEDQVQNQGKELGKRREQRCMFAPRTRATGAAKDIFSIRVSSQ